MSCMHVHLDPESNITCAMTCALPPPTLKPQLKLSCFRPSSQLLPFTYSSRQAVKGGF